MLVPAHNARYLAEALGARHVCVDGAGHGLLTSHAAEVNALLLGHWRDHADREAMIKQQQKQMTLKAKQSQQESSPSVPGDVGVEETAEEERSIDWQLQFGADTPVTRVMFMQNADKEQRATDGRDNEIHRQQSSRGPALRFESPC
jgi:hypothetical protein